MIKSNHSSKMTAALLALLLLACVESSSDWVKYHHDHAGNFYFYKIEKIKKDEATHLVKLLDKQVYSEKSKREQIQLRSEMVKSTKGWEKLSHITVLTEIDCVMNRDKTTAYTVYDTENRVLLSGSFNEPAWGHIVSSSIHEVLMKKVCSERAIEIIR